MIERGINMKIFTETLLIAYALDLITLSEQNNHNFSLLYFPS